MIENRNVQRLSLLLAGHPSYGSAAGTYSQNQKNLAGLCSRSAVHQGRHGKKNQKIAQTHHKPPEKSAVVHRLACKVSSEEAGDGIDDVDSSADLSGTQMKLIQKKGQGQEQDSCGDVRKKKRAEYGWYRFAGHNK